MLPRIGRSYLIFSNTQKKITQWRMVFFSSESRILYGIDYITTNRKKYHIKCQLVNVHQTKRNNNHKLWEKTLAGRKKNWIYNRNKMSGLNEKWWKKAIDCMTRGMYSGQCTMFGEKKPLSSEFNWTYQYIDWADNNVNRTGICDLWNFNNYL